MQLSTYIMHEFLALGTIYVIKMGTKREVLGLVYKNNLLPLEL